MGLCNKVLKTGLIAACLLFIAMACDNESKEGQQVLGHLKSVGNGQVSTYAETDRNGKPVKMGVILSADALEGLPEYPSDEHNCADRNEDGKTDRPAECSAWYEFIIPLPSEVSRNPEVPFKWVLLNWNPGGHIPPGVWDRPHFDVHYYMEPIADIFAIEPGPCGPEFVNCDQFEIATKPLPDNFMHPDFKNVNAVAPAMGNHLVDPTGEEFADKPFTHSWIYGTYDGRVIFYEQMITRKHVLNGKSEKLTIKSPPAVKKSGYYPTIYSLDYSKKTDEYFVSIEGFEYREASEPQWSKSDGSK